MKLITQDGKEQIVPVKQAIRDVKATYHNKMVQARWAMTFAQQDWLLVASDPKKDQTITLRAYVAAVRSYQERYAAWNSYYPEMRGEQ